MPRAFTSKSRDRVDEAGRDRHLRGEVEDRGGARHGARRPSAAIAHVAEQRVEQRRRAGRASQSRFRSTPGRERLSRITDAGARREEAVREVRADEAGAAGDQDDARTLTATSPRAASSALASATRSCAIRPSSQPAELREPVVEARPAARSRGRGGRARCRRSSGGCPRRGSAASPPARRPRARAPRRGGAPTSSTVTLRPLPTLSTCPAAPGTSSASRQARATSLHATRSRAAGARPRR